MRSAKLSSKVVGFCLTAFGLAACQAVAGIEDRTLDPNAGKPVYTQQCHDYCDVIMDACTGSNTVYTTRDICLGVCARLDPGDAEDTSVNTIACRQFYADEAEREPADNCRKAGPGGGGKCGTDCEAYCQLYPAVCPDDYKYKSTADCLKFCGALVDQPSFDVARDHDGDTIECRLVHVSSATLTPEIHCAHSPIFPEEPCIGVSGVKEPLEQPPTCEDYCSIILVACTGDVAQYQSQDECLAVCQALPRGANNDEIRNTVGCRRYHAFNSTLGPDNHCAHSGPTGDGHCGQDDAAKGYLANCESYCTLVAAACTAEFEAQPWGTPEACMAHCIDLPEAPIDSKYSVTNAEASTGLHCRVLHSVRAFADKTACASALGGDQCTE